MWWGLPSDSYLTLSSQSVNEGLVFTNCKFQGFVFCFARHSSEATDKVQHRLLIISSSPDTVPDLDSTQNVTIIGLLKFQNVGTFPINEVLSEKALWFEENKALPLCSPGLWDEPKIQRHPAVHSKLCWFIPYRGALNYFLKEPSSRRQGKDKRHIKWIHYMSLTGKKKIAKQKTPKQPGTCFAY